MTWTFLVNYALPSYYGESLFDLVSFWQICCFFFGYGLLDLKQSINQIKSFFFGGVLTLTKQLLDGIGWMSKLSTRKET